MSAPLVNTNISSDVLFSDATSSDIQAASAASAASAAEESLKKKILIGVIVGVSVMLVGEMIKRKFFK